jgi:predicted nucleotidyltransferase
MTRDDAVAKLKSVEAELRRLGVEKLYLYGSVARDEADARSDVDLFMEDPTPERPLGFREYMRARELLEELFGRKVDFTTRRSLDPLIVRRVNRDAFEVF